MEATKLSNLLAHEDDDDDDHDDDGDDGDHLQHHDEIDYNYIG